jgi:anti-sigma regulatory factor (Ser/Thr protein kinase)
MRMVGTVALDLGRAPGASAGAQAVALACDLRGSAVLTTRWLRRGTGTVVRMVAGALRAGIPAVAALVTSFRTMHVPWATASQVSDGHVSSRSHRSRPVRPGGRRELVLPADATAPGRARAFLRRAAQEWGIDEDLAQDAAMVLTELVANSVDHARTASTLSLGLTHEGLCVAVRDTCPGPVPRPAPIDPTAARGRGLQMVDALTRAWGVTMHAGGKTVWAVLGPV